jgi:hypothetical protein
MSHFWNYLISVIFQLNLIFIMVDSFGKKPIHQLWKRICDMALVIFSDKIV